MMNRPLFKTFKIHAGTYDFGINFCITSDLPRAVKWVNWKLESEYVTAEDFDCLGKRIYRYGYCPIIWLPKIPKTPTEIGTAQHELFHAICDCMRWAGIHLVNDTEEAYCHLIKHITKQFFEKLK
jgi:hypothetical protein